jgi:YHS domain-containing protein
MHQVKLIDQKEKKMFKDPVCGMDVDPKTAAGKSDYQGKTYYFCSTGCKKDFDKDPTKYVGKVEDSHTGHH